MAKVQMTNEEVEDLISSVQGDMHDAQDYYDRGETIKLGPLTVEIVCSDCHGTGEVTTMEKVYQDEGSPTAPIGTAKCHCQKKESEYDNQE